MRKLILYLSYFFIGAVCASDTVIVTVSEQIGNRTDNEVRQSARLKAKWKGINQLPIVVAGEQHLRDNEYSEQISVIGIDYVNVKSINEVWNREKDVLVFEASVTSDPEQVLKQLKSIKQNLSAIKRLKVLYRSLDDMFSKSLLTQKERTSIDLLVSRVKIEPFFRKTAAETIFFKNKLIRDIAIKLNTDLLAPAAKSVVINIVDVSYDSIEIKFDLDESNLPYSCFSEDNRERCDMDNMLGSKLTADFYYHHKQKIHRRVGRLCLLTYAYVPTYGDSLDRSANYRNYAAFIPVKTNFESLPELVFVNQYENHVVKRVVKRKMVTISDNRSYKLSFDFDPIDDVLESPESFLEVAVCVPKLENTLY